MKLVSYSQRGRVRLGALLGDRVVDLLMPSDMLGLLRGGPASMDAAREALAFAEREGLGDPVGQVRFLAPITRPGKVVCVGLNYRSHLAEIGEPVPEYPILFHKAAT